jgi:hypothetical protein
LPYLKLNSAAFALAGNMFSAGATAAKAADRISRRRVILMKHLLRASRSRVADRR